MLGSVLRGEIFDRRKALLFTLIIVGFINGGTFGAYMFGLLKFNALLVPGLICLLLEACYRLYIKEHS